jgi:hypothetical protein
MSEVLYECGAADPKKRSPTKLKQTVLAVDLNVITRSGLATALITAPHSTWYTHQFNAQKESGVWRTVPTVLGIGLLVDQFGHTLDLASPCSLRGAVV